jgi:hypothetical protein
VHAVVVVPEVPVFPVVFEPPVNVPPVDPV